MGQGSTLETLSWAWFALGTEHIVQVVVERVEQQPEHAEALRTAHADQPLTE